MVYKSYSLHNFRTIPQVKTLPEALKHEIEVVAHVLPFKVNNYVIDQLINWGNIPDDPIFRLTFPREGMLLPHQYARMENAIMQKVGPAELKNVIHTIREELNPHPAGQVDMNVPRLGKHRIMGMQHKYRETVLFFPSQGQTCHAYCTFCFRWPQFTGMDGLKFSSNEPEILVKYLQKHPYVTDIIFTGGDPMMMSTRLLRSYIEPLLQADLPHLKAIRVGTKSFAYWPFRFTEDADADDLFDLFQLIRKSGKHLALMAHFNHPAEMKTPAVKQAVARVIRSGIQIRTQSPLVRSINDSAKVWIELWKKQLEWGCIPYYMFIERDTGSQHYFSVPLVRAWEIFKEALHHVSGIGRTVRGPSMSCTPGKIEIVGVSQVGDEKVIVLRMIQGRNPDWVLKPFFAQYSEQAVWLDELKPAFGKDRFFFEQELDDLYHKFISDH